MTRVILNHNKKYIIDESAIQLYGRINKKEDRFLILKDENKTVGIAIEQIKSFIVVKDEIYINGDFEL